jgi:hypothetical protein
MPRIEEEGMNTRYKPLQTHGRTVKTWQPPHGDRFVEYDSRDEAWMRPLGLGRVVDTPEAMFDVRDERGELVGYTAHDPSRYPSTGVMVYVCDPIGPSGYPSSIGMTRDAERKIEIIAPLFRWPDGEPRIGWRVMLADVPDLIRVKWITVLGEDNIKRAIYDAERKAWESQRHVWSVST